MNRPLSIITALLLTGLTLSAQTTPKASSFKPLCDSLSARFQRRSSVHQDLKMSKILKRGSTLDLYFNNELSYYPWRKGDAQWFRAEILSEWNNYAKGFQLGKIFTNKYEITDLALPLIGNSGKASDYELKTDDPRQSTPRFIRKEGEMNFSKGLSDRYIVLWQSHGRYYNATQGIWMWQRACLHRTVEDMYTQSYVLPFLIPMLENAGAYVMTPRERDTQWREIICDNDPSFKGERALTVRKAGYYAEKGKWSSADGGFADFKKSYTFDDNPFTAGTVRMSSCSGKTADAFATWTPDIEERGRYAVYVSYKTFPNSSKQARYTVRHMGGESVFKLNQQMGGSTWIYLGTFEFDKGRNGSVILDNSGENGSVVSADAVKIGGGMGKLEREGKISGMPSSAEGAHYWMQWAGVSNEITQNWDTDYINDYATRGAWTKMMKDEKNIPVDMALAFHTDAGLSPNDSTVGTLAIYTFRCEGNRKFENSTRDRSVSRLLCDYVQTQVVDDIRADFVPDWSRRGLWDKSYSETRTTDVPTMILELLSHQNFADMKCGLDPSFRFTVCRAVYKGMLKAMSDFYGCSYAVQPLPVKSLAVRFASGNSARISWEPVFDEKEPTAKPEGYIVYTRVDDGAFDTGKTVSGTSVEMPISDGHIYSYKLVAYNAGGKSFPSGTLSIGRPLGSSKAEVVVVDNFDRISAPAWFDTPNFAGFDARLDSGVPYMQDISYIGENYEYRRDVEYVDDDFPGFGASHDNHATEIIAGNTFDYAYVHGKAIMNAGHPFFSMSRDAFCADQGSAGIADIICGKQGRTRTGTGSMPDRFEVFPAQLKSAIRNFSANGGSIYLSGANIASDAQDSDSRDLLSQVFGCKLANAAGTGTGMIEKMEFFQTMNPQVYCVERPDGLKTDGKTSKTWLRYPGSPFSAAVYNRAQSFRSIAMGVPFETLKKEEDRMWLMKQVLAFLADGKTPSTP